MSARGWTIFKIRIGKAMKIAIRLGIVLVAVAVAIILAALLYMSDHMDKCLDAGGGWDHANSTCIGLPP